MRVLIIDDEPLSVKGIENFCQDQGWEEKRVNFDDSYAEILKYNPDVVILDWYEQADENAGKAILDTIWKNGYRQIIIFSGKYDLINIAEEAKRSTLLQTFSKGDEEPVEEYLQKNQKYIEVLSQYRDELGNAIVEAFNVIEPIKNTTDKYIGDIQIKYLLARRTADLFDLERRNINLPQWAMYTYPPVSKSLTVCDILRKNLSDNSMDSIDNYRLVLTPSCDMVSDNNRSPKVSNVVCAQCYDQSTFLKALGVQTAKEKAQRDHIHRALTAGHYNEWVPLPKLEGMCPTMCVNLKKLELISLDSIAVSKDLVNNQSQYIKIGEISSPFREQIVWAYMQNACRPGVPDRAFDLWEEEYIDKEVPSRS